MRLGFHGSWLGLAMLVAAVACLPLTGCGSGSDGSDGSNGAPGASTGLLQGTVTSAETGTALSGAQVAMDPATGAPVTTGTDGTYSVELPIGAYDLMCTMADFEDGTDAVSLVAATTTTCDFELVPENMVKIVISGAPSPGMPDGSYPLTATATPMDGSTVEGYHWEQSNSVDVIIEDMDSATPTVILPGADAYMDELVHHAHAPERWDVLPINPHQLEAAEAVTLTCTVTTTSGEHTATVDIHAHLDFGAWATGLRNVPTGVPVVMNGKMQGSYDWTILDAPSGSTAVLNEADTMHPWFVPDVEGLFTLRVTDESDGPMEIPVYVGDWAGGIDGRDPDGRPTTSCAKTCHSTTIRDKFDDWAQTGHAEIFTDNMNTGGHYSSGCFACHTVGFDPTADNNGMDDQSDYDDFYATMWPGGHMTPDMGNYDRVLADWPNTGRMSNIQCENCHGPNGPFGSAHGWNPPTAVDYSTLDPRMSTRSDVCAFCHGEPPRHARYQQWEESGHGNYELAMAENRTSCNYCHTAQGYLNYYSLYLEPDADTPAYISLDADAAHPITCVVCHDPHNVGTTSGHGTNAPMRVEDNAYNLKSGFDALAVGKGALCMTCHNARRGLQNDAVGLSDPDRSPHGGPQTDVLMGMNAFFVDVGYRGAHSFLTDTCVTCHVELTPPPADLSYQLGGTNHTFEAKLSICGDCHGAYDGGTLADAFENGMEELQHGYEGELYNQLEALDNGGYDVVLTGLDQEDEEGAGDLELTITDWTLVSMIHFTESHGRQAIDLTYAGTTIYHVQLDGDTRITDGVDDFGSLLSSDLWVGDPDDLLGKAGWNYLLLHNDGSHGFHNPGFAQDIMIQTFYVLEGLVWNLP
jgi:hypothetical protein